MRLFLHLLYFQFLQFTRSFYRGGKRRIFYLVFLIIFPVSIFSSSLNLFHAWMALGETGERLFANLVSTSLLGFFVFLSIGGVPFILHSLGKSSDLNFFLAAPVPRRMLFLSKMLISGFYNSTVLLIIGLPMLLAYAWVSQASALVFGAIVFVLLLFIQIPTFVATLLSVLFLKLTSMTRARNLATVVMGILFLLAWIGFQFLRLERLNPTAPEFDPMWTQQFAGLHLWRLLPSQLFGELIIHLVKLDLAPALISAFLGLSSSAVALGLGVFILDKIQQNELMDGRASKKSAVLIREKSAGSERSILFVLMRKDMLLLWRDSHLVMSFIMLFVMIIIFPFVINFSHDGSSPLFQFLIFSLVVSALVANVSSRFIPFEGKGFRLNLISPQPLSGILVAKMVLAGIMALAPLVAVFAIILLLQKMGMGMAVSAATMLAGSATIGISTGTAMGIRFANFKYVNPRYMLSPPGNLLLPILTAAVTVFGLSLFMITALWITTSVAVFLFILYSGLVVAAAFRYSLVRCQKLEWYF